MRLARAAAVVLLLKAAGALAAENYALEIDAPAELAGPLRERTIAGRWRSEPGFDPGQFELFVARSREEATTLAQGAGYYSAAVEVEHRVLASGGDAIRISVVPGPRTTVERVDVVLAGEASGTRAEAALRDSWAPLEGAPFRFADWELAKKKSLEILQGQGYLRASIAASRADVDPVRAKAALSVTLDSGPAVAFGPMRVHGLEKYPEEIVRGLRTFREGDAYSFDRLVEYRQRLQASGFFLSVSVLPDLAALESDASLAAVPVIVDVRESPVRNFTAGLGYSTDQGLRVLGGYVHRNLLDRGWLLESGLLYESIRRRAYATVSTPWDETGHRVQGGIRFERQDITGELVERSTAYVGRGRWRGDIESFASLQYQVENRKIDTETDAPWDRRQALSLGYAWNLRRLDSRIDPRDGYTVSAQFSGAAKGVGSDRSFARLYGRAMAFWPMPRESVLAGGVVIGLVEAGWVIANSPDDIPTENLFRAGGAQSLRGYAYQSLGVPDGNATVGGRVLALVNLEYQHPVAPKWFAAAFYDRGNAADSWSAWRPVSGYGAGARWHSPVGPVNLDLAYGQAEHAWRVHFSVGYSF